MQSVALITQLYKTTFFPAQFTISARATAWVPPTPCVYLLSQYSSQPSLYAINQTITGNCPFSIGLSYYFNGGSSSSGNQFFLHGDSANSSGNVSPTPIHAPYMSDPLARVVQPSFGACA